MLQHAASLSTRIVVRRAAPAAAALALVCGGLACGSDESPSAGESSSEGQKTEVVKVAGPLTITASAAYNVAHAKGYFEQEHLKVEGAQLKAGQDAIALLSSGQIDVVIGGTSAGMFNALSRGVDFKVVGTMGMTTGAPPPGGCQLEAAKSISSVKDLKGKKIAVSGAGGSTGAYLLAKAIESGGLTLNDVKLVNIDHPDMEAAVKSGAVAAALAAQPFNINMEKTGVAKPLAPCPGDRSGISILFGPKFIEKPAAQRFFNALRRASAEDLQGEKYTPEVLKILAEASGQKLSVLEGLQKEKWDPALPPPVQTFEESQQVFMESGTLDYDKPIPMSKFIDQSFSQNAAS